MTAIVMDGRAVASTEGASPCTSARTACVARRGSPVRDVRSSDSDGAA